MLRFHNLKHIWITLANMAPIRKRSSIRARASAATKSPQSQPAQTRRPLQPSKTSKEDSKWRLTKKDKRAVKHNTLMSRVKDAGVTKNTSKRRRPAKKLKAAEGLGDDLRDALPDVDGADNGEDDGWKGFSDVENMGEDGESMRGLGLRKRRRRKPAQQDSKIVMKSLRHRPGAMKRKNEMHQREVERFGKNLAQMVGNPETQVGATGGNAAQDQSGKWSALRSFISTTMERDPAFAAR